MVGGRPRLRGVMGELSFEGDELELELERLDILSRRWLWFRRVGGVVAVVRRDCGVPPLQSAVEFSLGVQPGASPFSFPSLEHFGITNGER